MKILRSVSGTILFLAVTASQVAGQVLPGPNGPVEFIGLERWKAQELFEAIQELDPDRPFHACAAVMKLDLGFADAAAFLYLSSLSADSERYTVVVGVEDGARVRYRPTGSEAVALPETWEELKAIASKDMGTLDQAARALHSPGGPSDNARKLAEFMGADLETLDQVWDLVGRADGEEDRLLAHEVLARDSAWTARAVATFVLGNFLDDDTSWHALAASMIDSHARVGGVARSMLDELQKGELDPVDWSGARATLSAILGGTNPFAFADILGVLVATDIDPSFGAEMVRESPDLLLAYAGAEHESTRSSALAFLRAVSGEDHGTDVEAWRAWVTDRRR